MTKNKTGLSFLWVSVVAFSLDLLTKYIVVQRFDLYESVNILPIFNLTYVRNYGAAFSFLAEHDGWQKYFFIVLAIGISLMLAYFMKKNSAEQKLQNSAYALIIGGALANMVDRAYNGFVVDFLDFYLDIYHYPVFNVADCYVTVSVALLIILILFVYKEDDFGFLKLSKKGDNNE